MIRTDESGVSLLYAKANAKVGMSRSPNAIGGTRAPEPANVMLSEAKHLLA